MAKNTTKGSQRDLHADRFADYVQRRIRETNMRQVDVARRAKVSRQTISALASKTPHQMTGKLLLPERETVERIAAAFGDPPNVAREIAGYSSHKNAETDTLIMEVVELLRALPEDRKPDALAILRALYERTQQTASDPPSSNIKIIASVPKKKNNG